MTNTNLRKSSSLLLVNFKEGAWRFIKNLKSVVKIIQNRKKKSIKTENRVQTVVTG